MVCLLGAPLLGISRFVCGGFQVPVNRHPSIRGVKRPYPGVTWKASPTCRIWGLFCPRPQGGSKKSNPQLWNLILLWDRLQNPKGGSIFGSAQGFGVVDLEIRAGSKPAFRHRRSLAQPVPTVHPKQTWCSLRRDRRGGIQNQVPTCVPRIVRCCATVTVPCSFIL